MFAKLAGSDVEEGSDTGYFDVEAVGDELFIRAEFNERERKAIHPGECGQGVVGVHLMMVMPSPSTRISRRY